MTFLALLFVVMPSVESFYQILSQLTVLLYLIAYLLMFAAAIYLRYRMKTTKRPFRIGSKGNGLMWIVGGVGFLGSLLCKTQPVFYVWINVHFAGASAVVTSFFSSKALAAAASLACDSESVCQ